MNIKNKKNLIITLALVLSLGATFAYFTDRATTTSSVKAGQFTISLANTSDDFTLLKPGDARNLNLNSTNTGNIKGVYKDELAIALVPNTAQENVYMDKIPFDVYNSDDIISYDEETGYKLKAGATPIDYEVKDVAHHINGESVNLQVMRFKFEESFLSPTESFNRELALVVDKDYDGYLHNIEIDYMVQGKQDSAKDIPWAELKTASVIFGKNLESRVPGALDLTPDKMFTYNQGADGLQITGFSDEYIEEGINTELTIPSHINNQAVKSIDDNAFKGKGLTFVALPRGLKIIGANAFADNNLKVVFLPNTVEAIGVQSFANNAINYIDIPDSVQTIGAGSFDEQNAYELYLSYSVLSSNDMSPNNENVKVRGTQISTGYTMAGFNFDTVTETRVFEIVLNEGKDLTAEGFTDKFRSASKLTDEDIFVNLNGADAPLKDNNGRLVTAHGITEISDRAFEGENLSNVTIGSSEYYGRIERFGESAFENSSMTHFIELGGLRNVIIGNRAFYGAKDVTLNILGNENPDTSLTVGELALSNLTGDLNNIHLGTNNLTVNKRGFYNSKLWTLYIYTDQYGNGNVNYAEEAFANVVVEQYASFGEGYGKTVIGDYAFANSTNLITNDVLERLLFDNSQRMIRKDVTIGKGIAKGVDFDLTRINLGTTLDEIDEETIQLSKFKLKDNALSNMNSITDVYISHPNDSIDFGENIFENSNSIEFIESKGNFRFHENSLVGISNNVALIGIRTESDIQNNLYFGAKYPEGIKLFDTLEDYISAQ